MVELDNLHYDFREIDGYNKAFNFIFGARECGKTAMFWMKKFYQKWKKDHRPIIYMVRNSVEISEALITSIFDTIINKFTDDGVKPIYKLSAFKDGITDVSFDGYLMFRIVSLNISMRRIKLAVLKHISCAVIDEYIIDPKTNEKYLTNEAFKIKEAYTTWRRECDGILRFYFLANPYSLYNPMFLDWKVDLGKLKIGSFYVGDNFVIHWCKLHPILFERLKAVNPLYSEGSEYLSYALEGKAINDANIPLGNLPMNFYLRFIFKIGSYYLGVYGNRLYDDNIKYHIEEIKNPSEKRNVYCFDFVDMVNRTQILSVEDRMRMQHFKRALMMNQCLFKTINDYYLTMEVYKNL